MPTPFTHLEIAQRLLCDKHIAANLRQLLWAERGAFLLGNIAADARVGSGAPRDSTHFYQYQTGIHEHPWRLMVERNPALRTPSDQARRVFVAGYVAHLSVDEIWSLRVVGPRIANGDWGGSRHGRFYMLHMLLIHMDERDYARLEAWQADALASASPHRWLGFITDDDLRGWQALIHEQIKPGGGSRTLEVLGERIGRTPGELRAFLDSPEEMGAQLWDHVPQAFLAEIEARMYAHAREQMIVYLTETTP